MWRWWRGGGNLWWIGWCCPLWSLNQFKLEMLLSHFSESFGRKTKKNANGIFSWNVEFRSMPNALVPTCNVGSTKKRGFPHSNGRITWFFTFWAQDQSHSKSTVSQFFLAIQIRWKIHSVPHSQFLTFHHPKAAIAQSANQFQPLHQFSCSQIKIGANPLSKTSVIKFCTWMNPILTVLTIAFELCYCFWFFCRKMLKNDSKAFPI